MRSCQLSFGCINILSFFGSHSESLVHAWVNSWTDQKLEGSADSRFANLFSFVGKSSEVTKALQLLKEIILFTYKLRNRRCYPTVCPHCQERYYFEALRTPLDRQVCRGKFYLVHPGLLAQDKPYRSLLAIAIRGNSPYWGRSPWRLCPTSKAKQRYSYHNRLVVAGPSYTE